MKASEDRHWYKLPVPLAWICGLDEHPAPNALADALGDRYLYKYNPIYARVRDAAIHFGYRFSAEDTPLWRDYQAFGLTTLHRILKEKTIPYLDTGNTLKRLVETNPKVAAAPGYLLANLRPNHAFHESAHGVAHAVLSRFGSDLHAAAPDEKDRFVLEAVLAESFANTVELLASVSEQAPISDVLFYTLNSYTAPARMRTEHLTAAGRELSAALRFTVLFLASFEANLRAGPPTAHEYERVAAACVQSPHNNSRDLVRRVTNVGFALNRSFRENTTPMYFDLLGYGTQYRALAAARWLGDRHRSIFACDLARALREVSEG